VYRLNDWDPIPEMGWTFLFATASGLLGATGDFPEDKAARS